MFLVPQRLQAEARQGDLSSSRVLRVFISEYRHGTAPFETLVARPFAESSPDRDPAELALERLKLRPSRCRLSPCRSRPQA